MIVNITSTNGLVMDGISKNVSFSFIILKYPYIINSFLFMADELYEKQEFCINVRTLLQFLSCVFKIFATVYVPLFFETFLMLSFPSLDELPLIS